jgi:hypothetical protein
MPARSMAACTRKLTLFALRRRATADDQALGVVVHVLEVEGHQLGTPQGADEAHQQQGLVPGAGQVGLDETAGSGPGLGHRAGLQDVQQLWGHEGRRLVGRGAVGAPVGHFSHTDATVAKFTPLYGLNELVHYPLVGGHFGWVWPLNLAVWLGVFVLGAVWKFRRDTARV